LLGKPTILGNPPFVGTVENPFTDSTPNTSGLQETSEGSDLDVMEEACERGRVPR